MVLVVVMLVFHHRATASKLFYSVELQSSSLCNLPCRLAVKLRRYKETGLTASFPFLPSDIV